MTTIITTILLAIAFASLATAGRLAWINACAHQVKVMADAVHSASTRFMRKPKAGKITVIL